MGEVELILEYVEHVIVLGNSKIPVPQITMKLLKV